MATANASHTDRLRYLMINSPAPVSVPRRGLLPAMPRREPSASWRCRDLSILVNNLSAPNGDDGPAGDLPSSENREPRIGELILVADRLLQVRIPDHNVGIGADRDGSLARVQTKQLRGIRRADGDELFERDALRANALRVKQRQVRLQIVAGRLGPRDGLRRIELVLACQPDVIGRDDVDRPLCQRVP